VFRTPPRGVGEFGLNKKEAKTSFLCKRSYELSLVGSQLASTYTKATVFQQRNNSVLRFSSLLETEDRRPYGDSTDAAMAIKLAEVTRMASQIILNDLLSFTRPLRYYSRYLPSPLTPWSKFKGPWTLSRIKSASCMLMEPRMSVGNSKSICENCKLHWILNGIW
jgi:hypothetical protein